MRARGSFFILLGALVLAVTGVLPVIAAPTASAAPGDLDPSFGDAGRSEPTWSSPWTEGHASAALPDGKLVIVGRRGGQEGDTGAWAIVQLTSDGQPDKDFGGGDGYIEL